MKKILFLATVLAAALFTSSCQQEKLEPVAEGGVTYTITLPDAVQTKGEYSEYDLYYEVYKTLDPTSAQILFEKKVEMTGNTTTVVLDLLNDQDYTVLFWANKKGEAWFNTNDLRAVHLLESASNNDDRDAFCGIDQIAQHDGTKSKTVTLKRPFAQINIATEVPTVSQIGYDVTPTSSLVKVADVPTAYNVFAGAPVGTNVEVTFADSAIPAGNLTVNSNEYKKVAMNYVLVPEGNVSVYYEITTANGTVKNTINNVPVKANYRTNIIGNLLTSEATYTVEIVPGFETQDDYVEVVSVSTAAELVEAIENASNDEGESTNIKLEGNINLNDLFAELTKSSTAEPQDISIPKGKEFTLDLNGYSITGVDEGTASFGLVNNSGNLTITNSSSNPSRIALVAKENRGWNAYSSVISNNPGGNLLVKGNVLIEHLGGTDMAYGIDNLTNGQGTYAVAVIDGATIKSPYRAIRQFLNGTEATNELYVKAGSVIRSTNGNKSIWMQDPSKQSNTGKLVVETGAELYGNVYISATEGSTEWPVSASVAAAALKEGSVVEISPKNLVGYDVVLKEGVYVFDQTYSVNDGVYTIYSAEGLVALSAKTIKDGESVVLAADIDLAGVEFNGLSAHNPEAPNTFDGQGHKVYNWTYTGGAADMGFIKNWVGTIKNVTIENATLKTGGRSAILAAKTYADIENCHIVNSSIEDSYWACGIIAGLYNSGSITGCSVDGCNVTSIGGVGGIVGVINESAGERKIENCTVKNSTVYNKGEYGEAYSAALVAGMLNAPEGTSYIFKNCTLENNTKKGKYVGDLFYATNGKTVFVDGVQQ